MLRIGAFALYFTVIFSFCVSLPTGELRFMLISEDQELQIGLDAFDEILDKEIISTNRRLKRILRRVGRRIVRHAHKPNVRYDWEFKLFDSGAVNAFCLPGGKVGFHEGILRVCQNEAGLAAVMGHEISHAISRHTGQRISRQLAINYIISYASVSFQDSEYHDILLYALGLGLHYGATLPFSREHELEADELGLLYMARAGYDPREAVRVWQRMDSLTRGARKDEFISTHPHPKTRIKAMKEQMPEALKYYKKARRRYGLGADLVYYQQ